MSVFLRCVLKTSLHLGKGNKLRTCSGGIQLCAQECATDCFQAGKNCCGECSITFLTFKIEEFELSSDDQRKACPFAVWLFYWLVSPGPLLLGFMCSLRGNQAGAGETDTQWLRALVALLKDLGLIPSTYLCGSSQLSVTPVLRNLMPSSGPCMHCTHGVYRHTCKHKIYNKICTHKNHKVKTKESR